MALPGVLIRVVGPLVAPIAGAAALSIAVFWLVKNLPVIVRWFLDKLPPEIRVSGAELAPYFRMYDVVVSKMGCTYSIVDLLSWIWAAFALGLTVGLYMRLALMLASWRSSS